MDALAPLQAAVAAALEDRTDLAGAYLFGSQARGDADDASDVDLGVLPVASLALEEILGLEHLLEQRLGRRVDVVDLSTASAFLALEAVRGERIFARDPVALDEFDLFVLRRAGDLAFFERERRRALASPRA